ncbi:Biotin--protein ligase [Choanephora cucurbitarum]|uniref:Biotin--protein ligase n=1 Tax=Choanephora cucurbitarum TaxID=101091 RepID=A0A1C7N967_9FUNG|nr:Biotin--protein ligase [Choanephora cucurbitarum]
MNVLIYQGNGTSPTSVKQTYLTLKSILGHAYDVMKVDADTLKSEPWEETCSLIVIPGGRDSPYCEDLNGLVNSKIRHYVQEGGRYLGFCAGAYYASHDIEFEKGSPLQVIGQRELAFFPGTSRGTMYPGFVYNSEKGARAVSVKTEDGLLKSYYNGGGYFVDAHTFDQVKVVCTYQDPGLSGDEVDSAAGVECQVGKGSALLFGIHPEYNIHLVDLSDNDHQADIIRDLSASLPACQAFLTQALARIGLKTRKEAVKSVPQLTPLYLSTLSGQLLKSITEKLQQNTNQDRLFKDSNDAFYIGPLDNSGNDVADMLTRLSLERESEDRSPVLKILYPALSNEQQVHAPHKTLTPLFDIKAYFDALVSRRKQEWGGGAWYRFGNAILYSEVITSTQTVLDKNYEFAEALPSGLVCLATNQIAGRGRGRNSWVSQAGALQFSFVVRHPLQLSNAPVVFIQYLIALAIVESIRTRPGYESVPLRLKWPNDIYADLPDGLKKVGGLLVNSSFAKNEFLLVIGCGVNLNNPHPTVSINDVIQQHNPSLKRLEREEVLAHALVTFEKYYMEFCEKGMGSWFLDKYYQRWLHSDKMVTLTTHDNEKAKIVGITRDYGMLEAVSVNDPRKRFTLQPDGNSFDMLKGLIVKKT